MSMRRDLRPGLTLTLTIPQNPQYAQKAHRAQDKGRLIPPLLLDNLMLALACGVAVLEVSFFFFFFLCVCVCVWVCMVLRRDNVARNSLTNAEVTLPRDSLILNMALMVRPCDMLCRLPLALANVLGS